MDIEIKKDDIYINDRNGAWFRVTKVEETKKGPVVRFKMGTGAKLGESYESLFKRKPVQQMSKPLDVFKASVYRFGRVFKL